MTQRSIYEIVQCQVTRHASYGLVVQTPAGEIGTIGLDLISNRPLKAEDWPEVGETISAVVMGYNRNGALRLCSAPGYVTYVRSAADIDAAREMLARVSRADRAYMESVEAFYDSDDAQVNLRWALSRPWRSAEPSMALRLLARAPSGVVLDLMGDLVGLVVEGGLEEEVHKVMASAGIKITEPTLRRSIESLLEDTELSLQQYMRLADFLHGLRAERPLQILAGKMLTSDDSAIRAAGKSMQESSAADRGRL